jgi:hypothetical protein
MRAMRVIARTLRVIVMAAVGPVWLLVYMSEGALDQLLGWLVDPTTGRVR